MDCNKFIRLVAVPFFRYRNRLSPKRYWPVIDSFLSVMSDILPDATTAPPCTPAPGPISIIKSAARIASSSCSTTITVLPKFFRLFRDP